MFIALGFCDRRRIERQSPAGGAGRSARTNWLLALDAGDVHLFGMERGGVHGRGDPRSRTQRAARVAAGHDRRHRHLLAAEHAVSLRDAGRRARGSEGQRVRRHRRAPARRARRRHHGHRRRSSAWRPASTRWTFAGPRVYYAMARDGVFFAAAAQRASDVQDAARVDRRAGGVGEPAHALRQRSTR